MSMPIYLMFIRVLLSVEFCFTLKTYLKGALFYNASASGKFAGTDTDKRLCVRISRHLPSRRRTGSYVDPAPRTAVRRFNHGIFSPAFFPLGIIRLFNWFVIGEK